MINNNALRYLKSRIKKNVLNQDEYDKIKLESQAAKELYEDKRFSFLIDFLNDNKKYILDLVAKNDLKDVTETIRNKNITKSFKIPKDEQYFENAGIYKFIGKLQNFLTITANRKDELDAEIDRGIYVLEEKEKKNG